MAMTPAHVGTANATKRVLASTGLSPCSRVPVDFFNEHAFYKLQAQRRKPATVAMADAHSEVEQVAHVAVGLDPAPARGAPAPRAVWPTSSLMYYCVHHYAVSSVGCIVQTDPSAHRARRCAVAA